MDAIILTKSKNVKDNKLIIQQTGIKEIGKLLQEEVQIGCQHIKI